MEHPQVVQRGPRDKWFVTHAWLNQPLGPFDTDQDALEEARKWQEKQDNEQGIVVS